MIQEFTFDTISEARRYLISTGFKLSKDNMYESNIKTATICPVSFYPPITKVIIKPKKGYTTVITNEFTTLREAVEYLLSNEYGYRPSTDSYIKNEWIKVHDNYQITVTIEAVIVVVSDSQVYITYNVSSDKLYNVTIG